MIVKIGVLFEMNQVFTIRKIILQILWQSGGLKHAKKAKCSGCAGTGLRSGQLVAKIKTD